MYLSALKRIGNTGGLSMLIGIESGLVGTEQTLALMRMLIQEWKTDPSIRDRSIQLISRVAPKDDVGEVDAIFRWVRDNIRYVRDVSGIETLHTPNLIIAQAAGDCDDKVILLCTMLESIGYDTRCDAVGFAHDNGQYSHVLADVFLQGAWVPMESTEPWALGIEPPGIARRMVLDNA